MKEFYIDHVIFFLPFFLQVACNANQFAKKYFVCARAKYVTSEVRAAWQVTCRLHPSIFFPRIFSFWFFFILRISSANGDISVTDNGEHFANWFFLFRPLNFNRDDVYFGRERNQLTSSTSRSPRGGKADVEKCKREKKKEERNEQALRTFKLAAEGIRYRWQGLSCSTRLSTDDVWQPSSCYPPVYQLVCLPMAAVRVNRDLCTVKGRRHL